MHPPYHVCHSASAMHYRQSIDYLLSFADFERSGRFQHRPDLRPLLSLLRRLGDPHLGRRTVHIAGSKGKGSVAAMVESILRDSGLSTGLFTSPHLHTYRERIRVNGEPIAEEGWARLTSTLRDAVEAEGAGRDDRRLVTFDLLTALAFLAFREGGVDWQVLETGLGGRLDSTNVFESKDACVLTAIGLEHTDVLGSTVEGIAAEKAGIVRPGSTVVIGPQRHPEAKHVMLAAAAAAGCPIVDVAGRYAWRRVAHDLEGQAFQLEGPGGVLQLWLPLLGEHQLENAAIAVACADALSQHQAIPAEAVRRGLAGVRWPGRMEVLSRTPLVVADGAHSRDSARRLREGLTDYLSCRSAFLIVGMSADKDTAGLAEELAPIAGRVVAVAADHPRAMPAQEVAAAFRRAGVGADTGGGVVEALDGALARAAADELICLTGSLFVAAEGRAHLQGSAATA